jgi:hypothetical protein
MASIPRDPNEKQITNTGAAPYIRTIHEADVPCYSQYDPSEVFDEVLDEHVGQHPRNIMIPNSWTASDWFGGEARSWGPNAWDPQSNYDTLFGRYQENQQRWLAQTQNVEEARQPQSLQNRAMMPESERRVQQELVARPRISYPSAKPRPPIFAACDGGYESDEDPVPPEYRYKR